MHSKAGELTGKQCFSMDTGPCKRWYCTPEEAERVYTLRYGKAVRAPKAAPPPPKVKADAEASMFAMLGLN